MLLWFVLVSSAMPQARPVQLDSSDWWSYTRQEELPVPERRQRITSQNRDPAKRNFQIAGITLAPNTWDFSEIRSKFGEGTEVARGDGASGRDQICYRSLSGGVHLVFEFGELDSVFYLFKDGTKWNGSELCTPSATVSASISTASGLRLGIGPREVKSILGNPSIATPRKLLYYFALKKKSAPEDLARLRRGNPNISAAEFDANFKYVDIAAYIEARFVSGKLNYLAVSREESY